MRIHTFTAVLALGAILMAGCSSNKSSENAGGTTATQQASAAPAPAASAAAMSHVAPGDAGHGKQIFMQDCSSCHGAHGEGGIGPALTNESSRKNLAAAIAWIEDPKPPMPKLYPSPLTEKDVTDVATFVESLK